MSAPPPNPLPPAPSVSVAYSRKSVSSKALKVLGATTEEVRFERAVVFSAAGGASSAANRVFVEITEEEPEAPPASDSSKPVKVLGLPNEPPLQWLQRRGSRDEIVDRQKSVPSKAMKLLGTTIDDVRIEKALLVLGEAPGREVPAGKLPRPRPPVEDARPMWAVAPAPPEGVSVFLCAFLPWGLLAPLNILKLQLNKVSPGAHLWVPAATEQCQAACGVARMWATLFWSMQLANAVACVYLHYHRERGLALLTVAQKLAVGTILLKAYLGGVIYWPIGLAGPAIEYAFALLFARALRRG